MRSHLPKVLASESKYRRGGADYEGQFCLGLFGPLGKGYIL